MRKAIVVILFLLSGCYTMQRFMIETCMDPDQSWRGREMVRKLNRKYGKPEDYGLR